MAGNIFHRSSPYTPFRSYAPYSRIRQPKSNSAHFLSPLRTPSKNLQRSSLRIGKIHRLKENEIIWGRSHQHYFPREDVDIDETVANLRLVEGDLKNLGTRSNEPCFDLTLRGPIAENLRLNFMRAGPKGGPKILFYLSVLDQIFSLQTLIQVLAQKGYDCLALELPGYGHCSGYNKVYDYSFRAANVLRNLVLNKLGFYEPYVAVGYGSGLNEVFYDLFTGEENHPPIQGILALHGLGSAILAEEQPLGPSFRSALSAWLAAGTYEFGPFYMKILGRLSLFPQKRFSQLLEPSHLSSETIRKLGEEASQPWSPERMAGYFQVLHAHYRVNRNAVKFAQKMAAGYGRMSHLFWGLLGGAQDPIARSKKHPEAGNYAIELHKRGQELSHHRANRMLILSEVGHRGPFTHAQEEGEWIDTFLKEVL